MILFTKEVFVQLKLLNAIYVETTVTCNLQSTVENWQVVITGQIDATTGYDGFSCTVRASSKDDAFRIYQELAQQVVDSGCVSELNSKLIDNVLKEKQT